MTNYKKLTDKEHILLRPGMYVGSTKHRKQVITLPQEGEVVKRELNINPAFVKIFDEILSNSADEHRRQKINGKSSLTEISVKIDKTKNVIRVHDNGGIPVLLHEEYEEWIPQIIFGTLRAGSNFDDSEERLVAGTNGVGSTLTNIFSLAFKVRTCDGKKQFEQTYKNNMDSMSEPQVSSVSPGTKGFTEITFIPDLKRFEMSQIDDDHIWALYKRCLDVAAANPKLKVSFQVVGTEETIWKFSSFQDYCNLFRPKEELFYEESERWKIGISHSETGALEQISFVNSVDTIDGGTHVDAVADIVVSHLREFLKKKHKIEVKPAEIKSQMMILVCCDIVNAQFSSQTKEKLITEPKSFGSVLNLSKNLLKDLEKSEIVNRIIDWNSQKLLAEENKKMREINKNISREKILKLVDAKSRNREACVLQLYEGDCIEENTEIFVHSMHPSQDSNENFRKIKEIKPGDLVLTHNNRLRPVIGKTEKVKEVLRLKTKNSEILASKEHRVFVYCTETRKFLFESMQNLIKGKHKIVESRLSGDFSFQEIERTEIKSGTYLFWTNDSIVRSTADHKICVFDMEDLDFLLLAAKEIDSDRHLIVYTQGDMHDQK